MSNKILITGGAGYIGSALTVKLLKQGYEVFVFDDMSSGRPDLIPADATVIEGDITNYDLLKSICSENIFSAIIHCAAKKAVGESEVNPTLYFHTNVTGSLNVLRATEEFQVPHLIFSSTAAVYDTVTAGATVTETSPISPINVYGQTKKIVEEMILAYARLNKIKAYTVFRYFNVAGDVGIKYQDDLAQNVFPLLAKAVENNTEFYIFGDDYSTQDGTGVRDYIHLDDLVRAHEEVLQKNVSGIFNLGTGYGFSVRDLVNAFDKQLELPVKVKVAGRRPGDPAVLVANADLAHAVFDWKPERSLAEMVESTIKTYQIKSNIDLLKSDLE